MISHANALNFNEPYNNFAAIKPKTLKLPNVTKNYRVAILNKVYKVTNVGSSPSCKLS